MKAKDSSEIAVLLGSVHNEAETLHDAIGRLEELISPILAPKAPNDLVGQPKSSDISSPIGHELEALGGKLRDADARLGDLIARVRV
jgi:hypothetical protein